MALNLPDYPAPPGNKLHGIYVIAGPASYTQITPGTPITGGQVITAASLGLRSIEFAVAMGEHGGTYDVVVFPVAGGDKKAPVNSITLQWRVSATATEAAGAADLDAQYIRLLVVGL